TKRVLFVVGSFADSAKDFVSMLANGRGALRRILLRPFDHPLCGIDRREAATLHTVESRCERVERLSIEFVFLRRHSLRCARERGGCLGWPPRSHISGDRDDDIDTEALQFLSIDGCEYLHGRLRSARWTVERKWQVCRPGADLHNTTARFPQSRKECVHHGQRAENVHFEFASDGVEWERLDRSRSQDSGVIDQKAEAAICLRSYGTSPALDCALVGDIATGQRNCAAGGLLEVIDFLWCDRSSKDAVAFCSETKRNISPKPTTGAGNRGNTTGLLNGS